MCVLHTQKRFIIATTLSYLFTNIIVESVLKSKQPGRLIPPGCVSIRCFRQFPTTNCNKVNDQQTEQRYFDPLHN